MVTICHLYGLEAHRLGGLGLREDDNEFLESNNKSSYDLKSLLCD